MVVNHTASIVLDRAGQTSLRRPWTESRQSSNARIRTHADLRARDNDNTVDRPASDT